MLLATHKKRVFSLIILISVSCHFLPIAKAQDIITPAVLDKIKTKYHGNTLKRFVAWEKLITTHINDTELEKLKAVNDFFNQFEFRSDADQIGRADYWMTPVEFIRYGGGDCEDFSIAKYFTLQSLGVSETKLRITYVKALDYNAAHMVLTYYPEPGAIPYVLDNLNKELKLATVRTDLKPVYSFNADGLWLAIQRGQGRRVSGSDRISLWNDLRERTKRDLGL